MGLFSEFMNNTGKPSFKWTHYFPIYENFFSRFINQSVSVLEIGVLDGGSLLMWRNYFGPYSNILGIDINNDSKNHKAFGVTVEIGDQSDHIFLQKILDEYGPFDIIIDDGSHIQSDVISTLSFFIDKMPPNSVYLIEDTHMSNAPYTQEGADDIYSYLEPLNRQLSEGYIGQPVKNFGMNLFSINYFDSVIALQFKTPFLRKSFAIGASSEISGPRELSPGFM